MSPLDRVMAVAVLVLFVGAVGMSVYVFVTQ